MTNRHTSHFALLVFAFAAAGCTLQSQMPAATPQGMSVDNQLHLAAVAERSGADGLALNMYREAATKSPSSVEAQARYARALADAGQLDAAATVLAQAIKACGPDPMLLSEHGRIELLNGQPSGALADFQAILDKQPANVRALTDRGVALDMLGRHPEAEASYREALKAVPDDLGVQNDLALSLLLQGRAKEAVGILQPLSARPDADDRTRGNLAVAVASAGQESPSQAATPDALSKAELVTYAAAVNRTKTSE